MRPPRKIELTAGADDAGMRIDKYLQSRLPDHSRTYYQRLIDRHLVKINNKTAKSSYKLIGSESISMEIPPPETTGILPEKIELDILYEDDYLLVVNKPAGMVVHPGAGVRSGTLVNALLQHCQFLSGVGGRSRPGIVHRLDKNTSGVLVVAKTDAAHLSLVKQFQNKTARREYSALVWGKFQKPSGRIETLLSRSKRDRTIFSVSNTGKKAITIYTVEEEFSGITLLKLRLLTGRTHQIRVHLNHIHHPVFGDPQYHGRMKQLGQVSAGSDRQFFKSLLTRISRQALHARQLGFVHPVFEKELRFSAPLPQDFHDVLMLLRNKS